LQGIVLWKSAGELTAKHCDIHSHPCESGMVVSKAKATFSGCKFYGNYLCGAVTQDKGVLRMFECEVHVTTMKEFSFCQMVARS